MRLSASLIGIAVMLGALGCQGSDEATPVEPAPTTAVITTRPPVKKELSPEERVSRWINACQVREILFTYENVAYIRFRDGQSRRVPLGDDATADRVHATASRQPCPDLKIIVAIE